MLNSIFDFPKPKSEDTFEDIVCDVYSREFQNPNLQRYGRSGQKQDGIDIVGIVMAGINYSINKLVAIQCKNHIKRMGNAQLKKEITDEIEEFEKNSNLEIDRYIFATSADTSKPVQDFVLSLNEQRSKEGKFLIDIVFWDDITKKLDNYPDLLYKYFTRYLPMSQAENIEIPDLKKHNKSTLHYSADDFLGKKKEILLEEIKMHINTSMKDLPKTTAYKLYLGFTIKDTNNFDKLTDISINFQEHYSDSKNLEEKFEKMINTLINITSVISNSFFSKNIVIYLDAEISLALLIGRVFRRSGINVHVIFKEQVWTSNNNEVPFVPSDVVDNTPIILENSDEHHVAFYFNASGISSRKDYVLENVKSWDVKPKYFLSYDLNGYRVNNASHAYAIASYVIRTIHNIENWHVKHIHLFLIVPKALALLIGNLLNTLNSNIHIYFLDPDRNSYLETGVITNNTF